MTDFLREQLEIYFIENRPRPRRSPSRCSSTSAAARGGKDPRLNIKKKLTGNIDIANRVQKFVDCRTQGRGAREIYIVEGDSALGASSCRRDAEFQGIMPVRGKILNCLKADYAAFSKATSSPT